ncbi:MAG: right-handed parallel beta-helix repeat-containing protein, partial [Verrucomicrobiota bacterium]
GTNAYHVVTVETAGASRSLLNLTITAGSAKGAGTNGTLGGGLLVTTNNLTVRGCRFLGNFCNGRGGAVMVSGGNALFVACDFRGNEAAARGGAVGTLNGATPIFSNSTFSGNRAERGGAFNFNDSDPTLTNCSISGNSGTVNGGGIQAAVSSVVTLENTLIWNNHAAGARNLAGSSINLLTSSTTSITTCNIENSGGGDPLFLTPPDPSTAPSSLGNLDLGGASSFIRNAGTNSFNTESFDLAGRPRIVESIIDIGAFESDFPLFVDVSATGSDDGSSWTNAFVHLQDALDAAIPNSRIFIAAGTYYPDLGFGRFNNVRTNSFILPANAEVLGGFPSGGGARDIATNLTILSGDLAQDDIDPEGNDITETVDQALGSNAYNVVSIFPAGTSSGPRTLSGVTITGGDADGTGGSFNQSDDRGGGIYCAGSSFTVTLRLEDVVIIGNYVGDQGGGIYFDCDDSSNLELIRCSIINNENRGSAVVAEGSGVTFSGRNLEVSGCLFQNNACDPRSPIGAVLGLALHADNSQVNPNTATCTIEDTIFELHGAEVETVNREWTVVDCNFFDSVTVSRCIFRGNGDAGVERESTLRLRANDDSEVYDSLFSGNHARYDVELTTFTGSSAHTYAFRNLTIAGGTGFSFSGNSPAGSTATFTNCVFTEEMDTLTNIALFRLNSLIPGVFAGLDPSTNPRFQDPRPSTEAPTTAGDYSLLPISPLIEAGLNPASTTGFDLLGNPRVFDADDDGTATIDIGAFEYPIVVVLPTDGVTITEIDVNKTTGQITLTVEADSATTYTSEYSQTMDSPNWSPGPSGSLSTGTNTVIIPGSAYGWPKTKTYFRLETP